jgi:hypothetical protein
MRKQKIVLEEYPVECLFEFVREDYLLVLVGYPFWRAYIYSLDKSFRIEIFPSINVENNTIEFPKSSNRTSAQENNTTGSIVTEGEKKLISKFMDQIPTGIKERVKIFGNSHWELIKSLIDHKKLFTPLFNTNPALVYLIVYIEKFNPGYAFYNHFSYLGNLILAKQKEILDKAGFHGSEQLVKIFSKINSKDLEVKHLLGLRNTLSSKRIIRERVMKLLSHSKTINRGLLDVLSTNPPIIEILSNKAAVDLISSPTYEKNLENLYKIFIHSRKNKINIHEIEDITQIEFTLKRLQVKIKLKKEDLNRFPPPPLPGTKNIIALRNVTEQRSWSKKQNNCIRNYVLKVKARKSYFYKVILNYEEATLEIKLGRNQIRMGDLLGTGNKKVSGELRTIVNKWFINNV